MCAAWLKGKKPQRIDIASPLSGVAVPLEQVPDEAFAGKHLGDGFAIEPAEGRVIAPFDGLVAHCIDSGHAIILEHECGLQLLVHIGINTVALQGKGFVAHVSTGDRFRAGQTLLEFDAALIREAGYSPITPVVLANGEELAVLLEVEFGSVMAGQPAVFRAVLNGEAIH